MDSPVSIHSTHWLRTLSRQALRAAEKLCCQSTEITFGVYFLATSTVESVEPVSATTMMSANGRMLSRVAGNVFSALRTIMATAKHGSWIAEGSFELLMAQLVKDHCGIPTAPNAPGGGRSLLGVENVRIERFLRDDS